MRILIGDDHAIIRKGLKAILLAEYPSAVIEETKDAEEIIQKTITSPWDIVICDLTLPGRSGLDVVTYMRQHFPATPVLVLSMQPEDRHAIRALKAGAAGYLNKETAPEELIKAVRLILMGRRYISPSAADILANALDPGVPTKDPHELLTHREFDIFQLLASGLPIKTIAQKRSLGVTTISTYRTKILAKMNMKSNTDLTRYALEKKLI